MVLTIWRRKRVSIKPKKVIKYDLPIPFELTSSTFFLEIDYYKLCDRKKDEFEKGVGVRIWFDEALLLATWA